MKKAMTKSGWKLGGGLLIVCALIGVRIVTADPDGIGDDIEALEDLEAELVEDAKERGTKRPEAAAADDDGLVARMSATVRDSLSTDTDRGPDPNRLVRCDLGGGTQFMRAADCQTRGGDLTDVDRSRR